MRVYQKTLAVALPVALVLSMSFDSGSARADLSLSAVGSLDLSNSSVSAATPTYTSLGTTVGFGFLASTSFIPMFSLELGALYTPRKVSVNDANGNTLTTVTAPYLEVPLLLRFTALPIISVGLGPYYAHSIGNLTVSVPGLSDSNPSFGANNQSTSDFGLEGSVGASLPIFPLLSVMGELNYLFGLTNQDSTGITTVHTRDLELLLGITLSI